MGFINFPQEIYKPAFWVKNRKKNMIFVNNFTCGGDIEKKPSLMCSTS